LQLSSGCCYLQVKLLLRHQLEQHLGQRGVNIMEFIKRFNAATASMGDVLVPVDVTVFADKSFTFEVRTPPASFLLKKAAKVEKGSGEPNKVSVGKVTRAQSGRDCQAKDEGLEYRRLRSGGSDYRRPQREAWVFR